MKTISQEQMILLEGGNRCAVAGGILVGTILIGAAVTAATWGGAIGMFWSLSTAMYGVYSSCE